MLIPEHKIQEVLERVDLVALVARHVELKKSGRSYKGRCPFHQEKTPSLLRHPERSASSASAARRGGDADLLRPALPGQDLRRRGAGPRQRGGRRPRGRGGPAARRSAQQLKEVTDLAAEHFRSALWDPDEGRSARDYLAAAASPRRSRAAFGLGWAPHAWTELADQLRERGHAGVRREGRARRSAQQRATATTTSSAAG